MGKILPILEALAGMTESRGGFVKGRFVEDLAATESAADSAGDEKARLTEEEPGAGASETPIEERLGAASSSVTKAVDEVIGAVRTLVGTEEGHRYLEARVERTGEALMGVLRELQGRVDGSLKKK